MLYLEFPLKGAFFDPRYRPPTPVFESESEVKVKSEVRIFLFPISLKIGSVVVQDKKMCAIFEFSDFAQKMWKKIRFKFENREKFYKGFPCKKKFPRDFFVK